MYTDESFDLTMGPCTLRDGIETVTMFVGDSTVRTLTQIGNEKGARRFLGSLYLHPGKPQPEQILDIAVVVQEKGFKVVMKVARGWELFNLFFRHHLSCETFGFQDFSDGQVNIACEHCQETLSLPKEAFPEIAWSPPSLKELESV